VDTNDLPAKFELALAHLEKESDQQDVELYSLQGDENVRLKEARGEEVAERDRPDSLFAALEKSISSSFLICFILFFAI